MRGVIVSRNVPATASTASRGRRTRALALLGPARLLLPNLGLASSLTLRAPELKAALALAARAARAARCRGGTDSGGAAPPLPAPPADGAGNRTDGAGTWTDGAGNWTPNRPPTGDGSDSGGGGEA